MVFCSIQSPCNTSAIAFYQNKIKTLNKIKPKQLGPAQAKPTVPANKTNRTLVPANKTNGPNKPNSPTALLGHHL
jgi:hypothetical protein